MPEPEHASQEESPPAPPRTEFGRWLDARIAAAHERWTEIARKAGVEPGKPISRQKVGNHLVKSWIDQEMLLEDEVQTDGKRDPAKVALHVAGAFDEQPEEIASEVDDYLRADLAERAKKAGLELPATDEPKAEAEKGDGWELGRE